LRESFDDFDVLVTKKEVLYHRLTKTDLEGSTGEVQDPKLKINSIFMTRLQFEEHMEILKKV
jgi:hypothetical protein